MRAQTETRSSPIRLLLAREQVLRELASFIGIGGAAALGFVLLSAQALSWPTGLPPAIVSALCYGVFIVPVYMMHRRFSFRSDAAHARALPRYLAVQGTGLVLAAGFSSLAHGTLALGPTPGALLVIALTSGVNFVILRLWAFAGAR
ncbi:GtrA family protein [Arsenicitalea aurantiaca]|uniref:GtrA family protein n=1 Tax=Arsenicitalea aurantiaca TaxID=1783274 RepID=A0A433XLF9_9HYPH|nr:GtrA family protein [Arsenicitalea aurantiaca]RUT34910.1 GtrA family protein [Arsenicitalea aurantiaca]